MKASKKSKTIALIFMLVLGVLWITPVLWLILSSFKTDSDFITSFANLKGPIDYLKRLIPREWTVVNYIEMFVGGEGTNTTANILAMFKNSLIVSFSVMIGTVLISSMSAYAYERLEFKGGNKIFWALMYMSMFPNVVSLLPMFRICNALGWVDNLNALIWPNLCGVFNIFLIRNFMKSIPKELDEAASIDGAGSMHIFLHIILPSIKPVLIVVALFAFNGAWNDFLWPSIIMTNPLNQTLTPGLKLLSGQYEQKWAHMIASCLVSMVPPFLLYLFAQKYFLQGISVQEGVKG
jgi:multiple sugar transport system permease protein